MLREPLLPPLPVERPGAGVEGNGHGARGFAPQFVQVVREETKHHADGERPAPEVEVGKPGAPELLLRVVGDRVKQRPRQVRGILGAVVRGASVEDFGADTIADASDFDELVIEEAKAEGKSIADFVAMLEEDEVGSVRDSIWQPLPKKKR